MADDVASLDPRTIDQQYRPFPSFAAWATGAALDTELWDRHTLDPAEVRALDRAVLRRAQEIALRAAAIDTGAIEGLYEVDRGFTITVAMQATAWEAAVQEKGQTFRTLFESQMEAYEYVLDFATQQRPMGESWIRQLHAEMCRGQETMQVMTEIGPQIQPFPKGEYKAHSNHVRRRDGTTHAYAPVDMTPYEMQRLVEELRSPEFAAAHPILQAAYAHYAFVCVHPFADGNGRVARALASVYSCRAQSIPLVIFVEHRSDYLVALAAADAGEPQPFTAFMLRRFIDSVQLVSASLQSAKLQSVDDSLRDIARLFVNRTGYTHEQIDQAGLALIAALTEALQSHAQRLNEGQVGISFTAPRLQFSLPDEYRRLDSRGGTTVEVGLTTQPPADAAVGRQFAVAMPRGSSDREELLLLDLAAAETLPIPLTACIPAISTATIIQLRILADRIVKELLVQLRDNAAVSLQHKGY